MDKIILQKIKSCCASNDSIIAAYLFGSSAKATDKPTSDIDLAILLNPSRLESFQLHAFITTVENSIGRPVDIVVLNRAGEVLQYGVRRSGKLIYERDAIQRRRFEVIGRKRYEDFLYLHKRYSRTVLYGEHFIQRVF